MIEFEGVLEGAAGLFLVAGIATFAAALLPKVLGRLPISTPMVFLFAGFLGFTLLPMAPSPLPADNPEVAVILTEICVMVSLMGAGLAINRPFGLHRWATTWRLLAITMPLSMLAVGLLGWAVLGLGAASAVLLAAVIAPTDPVLVTEVQVSEPIVDDDEPADDEVRFALTSEAGLNDSLAFPFIWAAVAMSFAGVNSMDWLGEWILVDVLWRLSVGVAVGLAIGWALGRLFFSSVAEELHLTDKAAGFVALAATFLAYGVAELAEGYGFIAVFICACAIRASERQHGYQRVMHSFVEQIERLLTVAVVVLLGGAIARGLFADIGWPEIAVALALLLVIRPVTALIGLSPGKTGSSERLVISFFGVRGVGSLFYVGFALQEGNFPGTDRLWAIVSLVVVGSIIIHGIAATPVMRALDRSRKRAAQASGARDAADVAETPV